MPRFQRRRSSRGFRKSRRMGRRSGGGRRMMRRSRATLIARPRSESKWVDNSFLAVATATNGGPQVSTVGISWATNTSSGNAMPLNGIPGGSGTFARIGRKVRLSSLTIDGRYHFGTVPNAQSQPSVYRILIVYDRQPNGALPAAQDVLSNQYTTATVPPSTGFDHMNMNNRDRFLILMDKRFILPPGNNAGVLNSPCFPSSPNIMLKKYIKLKGLETHYKTDNALFADIATGALLMGFMTDDATNASGAWLWEGSVRTKFYDCY